MKGFGFPKTSFYYQPDTATLRVISLQSLKYQKQSGKQHRGQSQSPWCFISENIFPQWQLLKIVFSLLIKETILFLWVSVNSQKDKKKGEVGGER